MLQSLKLKYCVQTIGIDQSLSDNDLHEHKCLENIKKLYKKLVSVTTSNNPKILLRLLWFLLLKDSPITVPYIPWHHDQSRKKDLENHCVFSLNFLDVNKKTSTRQSGAAKSKRKAIKYGTTPWALKEKKIKFRINHLSRYP